MVRNSIARAWLLPAATAIIALSFPVCGWAIEGSGKGVQKRQMGGSIQGAPLSLAGVIATLAATSPTGSRGGTGTSIKFKTPWGIATDGKNLYVADAGNHMILKVVIASGEVTTLAGKPGSVWNTDDKGMWTKSKASSEFSPIEMPRVGTPRSGPHTVGKIYGTTTRFESPSGVATDGANLYVSDSGNHAIFKVVIATGEVTTLAGKAGSPGSADGNREAAQFRNPEGITTDGTNLYVSDTGNNTIRKVVIATGVVTTLAGTATGHGFTGNTGATARFSRPSGITTDGTNLYVTTPFGTIHRIVIVTGEVTTLAGKAGSPGSADGTGAEARFSSPSGIATDGTNLYVTDSLNHTIRKVVIATGAVTTLAGKATPAGKAPTIGGFSDGTREAARFDVPLGIATDGTRLYVTDKENQAIRKIVIGTGEVMTLAGRPPVPIGSGDGRGAAARFNLPAGITTEGTTIYVADKDHHTIRKVVIATGAVRTLAGKAGEWGAADGTGAKARFSSPSGIATDGTHLYVTDFHNHTIRKVAIATGAATTLAGKAGSPGAEDGRGEKARFKGPSGIATDGTHLYVTDSNNHTIRKVVIATGEVTTLAGRAGSAGSEDGAGTAARFRLPAGIATAGTNLYVADSWNYTIRKVEIATGAVTTLAGKAGSTGSADGTGATVRFGIPGCITTDRTNLYVTDSGSHTIRRLVIATGEVTTLAGKAGSRESGNGTGAARFSSPSGITTDGANLYVADTGNHTIRKVVIGTGEVTTLAGTAGLDGSTDGRGSMARSGIPWGVTTDGANLYMADRSNHTIRKIVIATGEVRILAGATGFEGIADGTGAAARFGTLGGITTDGRNLYVADWSNHAVRKVVIATGEVTTLAGKAGSAGSAVGTAEKARFISPSGITTDGKNLYVTESMARTIRKVVIATGEVTTLAGKAGSAGDTDGVAAAARFGWPQGITTDGTNLFVTDMRRYTIRKIGIRTGEVTTLTDTPRWYRATDGSAVASAQNDPPEGITTDGTSLYVADSHYDTIRKVVIATGEVTILAGTAGLDGFLDATGAEARFDLPAGITTDGTRLFVTDAHNHAIRVIE